MYVHLQQQHALGDVLGLHSTALHRPKVGSSRPGLHVRHASTKTPAPALTHTDAEGRARMVDVGDKPVTRRVAEAEALVQLPPAAFALVQDNSNKKGDVLTVAQLAGIMGAKHTSLLIPLCHNVPLSHVGVELRADAAACAIRITTSATTTGTTGVEMEALTAASVAALTVYDMCKAVSHDIVIARVRLLSKAGGQRGAFSRASTD